MSRATGVAEEATEPTESTTDEADRAEEERADDHLDDLPDGAGCTEIWEHLSEDRDDDA